MVLQAAAGEGLRQRIIKFPYDFVLHHFPKNDKMHILGVETVVSSEGN